ncbi:MAG TPA: thiamine pyrophosphate-binding protein [Acidimicrobiia bacterium]|nr:thiamine pyrophosphate-binding protein [Acidimicrobiia bacterium]
MKVYERIAAAFLAEGVRSVFGLMGDGNMHWIDAMARGGCAMYHVRHEGPAVALADGWARVMRDRGSDLPGVATTTHGPGFSQLATTLLVASRARTRLVVFVGEGPEGDNEFHQRLDHRRFAQAVECGFERVSSAEPDDAVRRAFMRSRAESRPIVLSVTVRTQLLDSEDADEPYQPTSGRNTRFAPAPDTLDCAVRIIEKSDRPVIIAGRGAVWSGAGAAVISLAERIGALVATTLMTKNWLNHDPFHAGISGNYSTRTSIKLFAEADCVIAVGAGLNKFTTAHGFLYPEARFIHIDSDQNARMGADMEADCFVASDARLALEAIVRRLTDDGFQATAFRTSEVADLLSRSLDDPTEYAVEAGTLDPRAVCRMLDSELPPAVGLVLGGGHQVNFGTMLMTKSRSLVLANQHFGAIGQGLTTAMGAAVAAPDTPLVLLEGDAGFLMYLSEFETAVRYELPLLVVVVNDQALGAEFHKMALKGLDPALATISTPDLGAVAVALGGNGHLINSLEDLRSAVAEFMASPRPTVLDVRSSRTVLSVPYRRVHHGMDV